MPELSELFFGKALRSLDVSDIETYFSRPQRETDTIEFKSYIDFPSQSTTKSSRDKDKLKTVFESICAFLNSAGGILIWGAPEGKEVDGKEKVFQGQLKPVNFEIEADQFTSKLTSEISPIPAGVNFHSIFFESNKFIYVIEVAKSNYPPHQHKGTYFMRLDGSKHAAPHHYVEALMKRVSHPKLQIHTAFGKCRNHRRYVSIPFIITIHNLSVFNNEKNVRYTIIASGCDILDAHKRWEIPELQYQSKLEFKARPVLHANMPIVNEFVILFDRKMVPGFVKQASILISAWGDNSPSIISHYEVLFKFGEDGPGFEITSKKENEYMYERKVNDLSPSEISQRSAENLLKIFEAKFRDSSKWGFLTEQF